LILEKSSSASKECVTNNIQGINPANPTAVSPVAAGVIVAA